MFCWFGWHWWEKEPFHKEEPRVTSFLLIFTTYSQYGTTRCICCDKEQRVHRSGSKDKWKPVK